MLKIDVSACIKAPVDKTWSILEDIESIPLWTESVLSAHCPGGLNRGEGAERICKLRGNMEIRVKWIDWQEGKLFTCLGYNLPLVESAKNKWSVSDVGGKTLLTSEATLHFKGGIFGLLLQPFMRLAANKMAADSLAAFKYLVENGKPFGRKHSLLPRVSPAC